MNNARFLAASLLGLAAFVEGCGVNASTVNGGAATPPSPARPWVAPPHTVQHDTMPGRLSAAQLPPDIGQRIQSLTLGDVVNLALMNNPATRASWAQARAAADVYGSAQGAYFPTITGALTGTHTQSLAVTAQQSAIQRSQLTPSIALSYLVLDFGGRSGSIEEARQNLFVADLTHNATLQTTILQVEQAYFSYMANRALLAAEQAAIAEEQANLQAAEQRHTVGLATIADVLQARTALSQEQLNLETIQGNLQAARGALAAAMGLPANLPYDLTALPDSTPVRMVAESVDSIIGEAVRNRPDLQAARAAAAASAAQVRVVRAAEFPSLSLSGSGSSVYSNPSYFGGKSYTLSLGLSIPIFNGFSHQYDVAAARENAVAAAARADLTREQVIQEVFTSYYALQTSAARVTTADALLASATESEQVAAGRYREGVGSIIDLLTAQSALATARAEQVQARWQWSSALIQLAHDAGVLGVHGEAPFTLSDSVTVPGTTPLPNPAHP